jgi:hypothetical protein
MAKAEPESMPKHNPEIKAAVDKILLHIPGVQGSKAFGYPAYKINGKVFAFVGSKGVSAKLPQARVRELVEAGGSLRPFEVAGGVVWKEWVFLELENTERLRNYSALFDEAIQYVAGTM